MRLTLRTLLAHLCGLLEPEDARNLDEKIKGSSRGQELARRIPKLIAKRELDAPRLESRAAGGDANTVSEYLDGILTPERTAEFDRVCLQSDRQLAEVASCFEILSVVHQKPAKVTSTIRQRIYGVGAVRVDDPTQDEDGPQPTSKRVRRSVASQPVDAQELAPHQRAAILEEYVDAPILKPAQKPGQSEPVKASSDTNPKGTEASDVKRPSDSQVLDVPATNLPMSNSPSSRGQGSEPVMSANSSPASDSGTPDKNSGDNWFADDQGSVEMAVGSNPGSKFNIPDVDSVSSRRWTTSMDLPVDSDGASTDDGLTAEAIEPPPREGEDEDVEAPPVAGSSDATEQPTVQVNLATKGSDDSKATPEEVGVGGRRRLLPMIAVAVIGIGLALVAVFATGSHNRVLAMFSSGSTETNSDEANGSSASSETDDSSSTDSEADELGGNDPDANFVVPEKTPDRGINPPGENETSEQNPAGNAAGDAVVFGDERPPLVMPSNESGGGSGLPGAGGVGPEPQPGLVPNGNPNPGGDIGLPPNVAPGEPERDSTMGGAAIGKLMTPGQILARQIDDSVGGVEPGWYRLSPEAQIYEVDQLLNLPSYRSQFSIGDAFLVTLIEASGLELMGMQEDRPQIGLRFGRMTIESNGRASVEAVVDTGSITGKATFADSDSKISVRVLSYLPPGSDPATTESSAIVDIIAVRGRVVWEDAAKVEVLEAGQSKRYVDGVPEEIVSLTAIPYWVEQGLSGIDLTGSESVADFIGTDGPIEDGLLRLADDSHVETRMLVAQCLSLLGRHQYCVQALSEDRNKSYWSDQVEWLRSVVARGPAHAQSLRETMSFVDTAHGEQAYRLLLGFSPEQIAAGGDAELIDLLESNELMLRVLAIDNLLKVTGTRGMFRPETPQRIRENHVRTWRKRLERSEVRYIAPPAPPTVSGNRTGE